MELTPEICQRLISVMEFKNITGYTIHKKLGISATTISNYLNGKIKNADNTKIKAICDLLDIDMKWLETGETNIVCRSDEQIKEYTEGSAEYLQNQILLALTAKDDQFKHIRKDTSSILDMINLMKKDMNKIKQEIDELKAKS